MMTKIFNQLREDRVFQDTDHNVVSSAEKSAHLTSGMIVINGQPTLIGIKAANRAAIVLRSQRLFVPFWSDAVAALEFFAPVFRAAFVRPFIGFYSCTAALTLAVGSLIGRILSPLESLLFDGTHGLNITRQPYGCQVITP